MTPDQPAPVPAGWYPDPNAVSELRWWDGVNWTDTVHPPIVQAPRPVPTPAPVAPVHVPDAPVYAPPIQAPLEFAPEFAPATSQPAVVPSIVPSIAPTAAATPAELSEPRTQSLAEHPLSRRELRERGEIASLSAAPVLLSGAPVDVPVDAPVATPQDQPAPAAAIPDLSEPVTAVPDFSEPATAVPDLAEPVTAVPDFATPTAVIPDLTEPTAAVPDSSAPTSFDWPTGIETAVPATDGSDSVTVASGSLASGPTPSAQTASAPVDSAWGQEQRSFERDEDEGYVESISRTSTTSGWFIALMPLIAGILSVSIVKGAENYPRYIPGNIDWWMYVSAILVLLYLTTLFLAAADRRRLDWAGHSYPAHWAWALLTAPVYLIARTVSVKRETGRGSALLLVWLLLTAILVGSWFAANTFAPELIEAYALPIL